MEKSETELKLIKEYEAKLAKKLKESEDQEGQDGSDAGEVNDEGEGSEKSGDDGFAKEHVAFDEQSGRIGFTQEGYDAFNKSIRESIYNK